MNPTPFQKKLFWTALAMVSAYAIGWILFQVGSLVVQAISFLQPLLIPVAIAAILAFLLEPVVQWLTRFQISRILAIIMVYLAATGLLAGIIIWILPSAIRQGNSFISNLPDYTESAKTFVNNTIDSVHQLTENPLLKSADPTTETRRQFAAVAAKSINDVGTWLQQKLPDLTLEFGKFLQRSVGGFLGVFGFLLSMILVPIFLFFFLKESSSISENWSQYLPLRASPLKNEVVSLVREINSYLVSFFRGQLMVSMIDGVLIGSTLLIMGLDFAVLIGLLVGLLGIIPYIGMMITWIPAVLIAAAQFEDWGHPIAVTIIFIVANNIDGMVIAPKIVGDSVGLHPLTVIASVLAWSLILGGLLGALLAVPLTATLKVLLKRYFWDRPYSSSHPQTEVRVT